MGGGRMAVETEPFADADLSELREEPPLAPGELLGPLHRVVKLLGEGGMGAVYEVEHVRTHGRWAAKVLRNGAASNRGVASRLEREAIMATLSDHPNVVQIVSFDETEDGRPFIIEELLDGVDLGALLGARRLSVEEALGLAASAAAALSAIHARGVIHLDLKPANLFIAEKHGRRALKILDFGISKMAGRSDPSRPTWTGPILGTAAYVAPEQTRNHREVGPAADIYALGLVLFEMLTGRRTFEGDDPIALVMEHREKAAPPVSAVDPSLPRALDGLVAKALEKDPAARYRSMADLAGAIEDCARSLGLALTRLPGDAPAAAERPRPRRRLHLAAYPLALGALIAAGVVATRAGDPPAAIAEPPVPLDPAAAAQVGTPALAIAVEQAPVEISFAGEPRAVVRLADRVIATIPGVWHPPPDLGRVKLTIEKDGFVRDTRVVDTSVAQVVDVRLKRARAATPIPPPPESR